MDFEKVRFQQKYRNIWGRLLHINDPLKIPYNDKPESLCNSGTCTERMMTILNESKMMSIDLINYQSL
jgi:hypothetical protein